MRAFNRYAFVVSFALAILGCDRVLVEETVFDSGEWKRTVDDRAAMLADLERSHLRVGMAEAELVELLGAPEEKAASSQVVKPREGAKWYLRYELDIEDVSGAFDSALYVVVVDADDKVVDFFLQTN